MVLFSLCSFELPVLNEAEHVKEHDVLFFNVKTPTTFERQTSILSEQGTFSVGRPCQNLLLFFFFALLPHLQKARRALR